MYTIRYVCSFHIQFFNIWNSGLFYTFSMLFFIYTRHLHVLKQFISILYFDLTILHETIFLNCVSIFLYFRIFYIIYCTMSNCISFACRTHHYSHNLNLRVFFIYWWNHLFQNISNIDIIPIYHFFFFFDVCVYKILSIYGIY